MKDILISCILSCILILTNLSTIQADNELIEEIEKIEAKTKIYRILEDVDRPKTLHLYKGFRSKKTSLKYKGLGKISA